MNNSGIAVIQAMEQFSFAHNELIVITDDFNIPEGFLRLREKGSAGGHNGLKSIIYHLETEDFARLRIGIGISEKEKNRDFVLSGWSDNEKMRGMTLEGVDAMERIIEIGTSRAMNHVNKKNNNDTSKQEAQVD